MYTVIGFPRTRAMRVMWTLEELGQDYELVPAMPQSPEVLALNPLGKVPVLKDGDHVLTDSVAICQYLADKHGALTYPAGTPERAHQDAVTQFTVDEVEGALWTAAKNSFIHPEELRVPEIKRVCAAEFATAMQRLEVMIGDAPFVMGETFTVPDILLGHAAGWARAAKFDVSETGPVAGYFDRVTARPAFKGALLRGKDAETRSLSPKSCRPEAGRARPTTASCSTGKTGTGAARCSMARAEPGCCSTCRKPSSCAMATACGWKTGASSLSSPPPRSWWRSRPTGSTRSSGSPGIWATATCRHSSCPARCASAAITSSRTW